MARYVMLQFESDEDAINFVEYIQDSKPDKDGWEKLLVSIGHSLVRGVWKKPTLFCQCTSIKRRGWTRGKKFGWFVCSECKRPSLQWAKGDAWYVSLGTNLLPISDEAPEHRGPNHKQHPGYLSADARMEKEIADAVNNNNA